MQDVSGSAAAIAAEARIATPGAEPIGVEGSEALERRNGVVSTHVLVPEAEAEKLRLLSRKTRVAQSEYLREAVDDLLQKYDKLAAKDGDA